MTTTHVSAGRRRRQRLRRTLVVTTVLVVAGGAAGYAAWHGDDPASPAAASPAGRPSGRADRRRARPKAKSGEACRRLDAGCGGGAKPAGGKGFAPVVTDRIPAPTTSLPLSAPIPGTTNMQAAGGRCLQAGLRRCAGRRA